MALYDLEGKTEAELVAECKRVAPLIGLECSFFNDPPVPWVSFNPENIWDNRSTPFCYRGPETIAFNDYPFRILTHYLPDHLFHHLTLSWEEGKALFPRLHADQHAFGLWRALLDNPRDEGRLNMLRDRIEEAELRESVSV